MIRTGNEAHWIIQALNAHILLVLLRTSHLPTEEVGDFPSPFLSTILPKFLIYESVLVSAGHAIEKVLQLGIAILAEPMKSLWLKFAHRVSTGLWLAGRLNRAEHSTIVDLDGRCGYAQVRLQ